MKHPTSFYLTEEAKHLLAALAAKAGVAMSAWLETVVRREAEREGVR